MAARNRAVEKWVTNNNGATESGKSGNLAKPRRMSQIDDEKSIGFSSTTIPIITNTKLSSLGGEGAVTTAKVRAAKNEAAAAGAPGPRTQRVASDAAGSGSGSVKGKVRLRSLFRTARS